MKGNTTLTNTQIGRRLRDRARRLRRDANTRLQPLGDALRRRAAELELEATIREQQLRPLPVRSY